ncbi:MAG TPA: mucoidy inhibitor MuiA family protein [Opitutus sp.]|nr:mucoidy inhibitor MuiA family protein [Opitutus sp.]
MHPSLPALATCLLASLAAGAPLPADSHITAVTVYTDRAVVTRATGVTVPAAGTVEVSFERLPASLLDESLQVTGRGTAQATLLDVAARTTFVDFTPNDRIKALEDELRDAGRQDRALADRATVLGQQRDYVLKIQSATTTPGKDSAAPPASADTWLKLLTFTDEQLTQIASAIQAIDVQRDDLKAKQAALEQQLNALRGEGGRSYKTVTVRLAAATAGTLDLTLRYAEPGASWTPAYDARVETSHRAVQLGYAGLVRQNTGEDWNGVDLTLSTARPALGGAAPELSPWIVQQQQFMPMAGGNADAITLSPFAVEAAKKARLAAPAVRVQAEIRDMASGVTTVETSATSATFHLTAPADVPADNAPHKVGITSVALTADFTHQATPKLIPAAFLSAAVTNSSDYPLLAGALNVFLDDTFVAATRLRTVMPGEKFDLALGPDDGIAVKRKLNNRFTEDTGLVTKGTRITYDYTITVQNNRRTAGKIVVTDQMPVSRHEKITVKLLASADAKPEADGTLTWSLDLKPGEKRELPLKFSIEYPNDLPGAGLE